MTTITKTTAQAVSRKLSTLNFDRYEKLTRMGWSVGYGGDGIFVSNYTHPEHEGTAAAELAAAGYIIENRYVNKWRHEDRVIEVFIVKGKAGN
jgi:hypothetical protein